MARRKDVDLEEALFAEWEKTPDVVEVPLERKPFWLVSGALILVGLIAAGRILYLGSSLNPLYSARAAANLNSEKKISAPRGKITDRNGVIIADNRVVFRAVLLSSEFVQHKELQAPTLQAAQDILGIAPEDIKATLTAQSNAADFNGIVLAPDLSQDQAARIKALNLSTLGVESGFTRTYPHGPVFSSIVGYTGLVSAKDIQNNPKLNGGDVIGKVGLEAAYDSGLQGTPGKLSQKRNAKGQPLGKEERTEPKIGAALKTTLDADFQEYLYNRMKQGLTDLGRTSGGAIAINPQNGEVLALMSFPSYDNNVFTSALRSGERNGLLTSPERPLFNRMVSGLYSPGSTIKPLVGVAALTEHVVDTSKTVFSPGYLDIPNPYNPAKPSRFLDWRYQGTVNMASAIAQSSDVYFYEVGGGFGDIKGLGITRLKAWWQKFLLDKKSGIDLSGEASGFLPDPAWKQKNSGKPWLLGDTYNVSIGQGDLGLTPIALLDYIDAIANGGTLYQPHIKNGGPNILADLSPFKDQISEIQKGMRLTVTSPLGTAYPLHDLPFTVGAKTGSAQIQNNTKENAFFVGYAPADHPQIAILIMVENAKEGSLNAVPIAKDILQWYYQNRIQNR